MRFLSLTFPAVCAAAAVSKCENLTKRVEWRKLDDAARQQYTDASTPLLRSSLGTDTFCTSMRAPSRNAATKESCREFPLPLKLTAMNIMTSTLGYWDWSLDADDTPKSTIWDPKTGFGGNGSPNKTESIYDGRAVRKCLNNGPFKDLIPAYLTTEYDPHCLSRNWNDGSKNVGNMLSKNYNKEAVAKVQEVKDYDHYRQKLEAGPHGAIHSAIGGDMIPNTSPNDPIFFLHHTQIDRLWSLWQEEEPKTRTMEFAGYKTQDHFDGTKPPPASLDDTLLMNGLADGLKVKDLMSTQSSLLCYSY
ncbi:Tyrosinase [Fusarium acutatum]|uniref:Tyrosinase n=1 Tax=Fusarium acutatum TaxID=78861 RepID=A0A8H4NIG1_9HYPO|nr:Tyrosinase [Fusarium acutatum]